MIAPGVVLTRETRTPPWRGLRSVVLDAAALGVATVLLGGAALFTPWAYLLATVVVLLAEAVLVARPNLFSWAAELSHAGPFWRGTVRGATACLLVGAQSGGADVRTGAGNAFVWVTLTWLGVLVAGTAARAGLEVVAFLRRSPVLTRNIDLTPLDLPAPPPQVVTARGGVVTTLLDVPFVLGAAVAVDLGAGPAVPFGAAGSLLLAAFVLAAVGVTLLRLRRHNPRTVVPGYVDGVLDVLRPEVLLYFAGRPSTLYQLQMWLEVAERLPRSTAVVLRDRDSLLALGPTSLPVLCVPQASTFAGMELASAKVVLLPSNAAENIHVLRRRGLTSVFIGHGDSDKPYSANPFVRAYDEVWVAGPAGRDRFAAAQVALADGAVVEVGRPQVALTPARHRCDPTFTVLYAPTWEGWGDVDFHTSVPYLGEALVRALLARPGVRVVYRPHPLTGSRDGATRAAHRRVLALLDGAGARRTSRRPTGQGPAAARTGTGPDSPGTDYLAHSVAHGRPDFDRDAHMAAELGRERAWWDAAPSGTHVVVDDGWPGVPSCFAEADLLVTDVSSVISDWLATDRPYAVLDSSGSPVDDFVARFPSTAGGRVVGPDLAALHDLLDRLATGEDPDVAARRAERARLLGERPDEAMNLFAAAVDRLCTTAPRPALRPAALPVPSQKDA